MIFVKMYKKVIFFKYAKSDLLFNNISPQKMIALVSGHKDIKMLN